MTYERSRTFDRPRRVDRDRLLVGTDLPALADELLGGHVGQGRSAKWPSPVPGHPQTGKSPPMSIFHSRSGFDRWKCFATGETGTAIDLLMLVRGLSCGDAINELVSRSSMRPVAIEECSPGPRRSATGSSSPSGGRVRARVEAYVATCEKWLWGSNGAAARTWLLEGRCLDAEVVKTNRVGYDPGPGGFARPSGLPRRGPAVVFPVLGEKRKAVYFQARYLSPDEAGRKYDNPPGWVAPNPRVALVTSPRGTDTEVAVTEGLPDALSAATIGLRAAAILGTSNVGREIATELDTLNRPLMIAFDNDDAGLKASDGLRAQLKQIGRRDRVSVLRLPDGVNDLNDLLRRGVSGRTRRLASRARTAPFIA
jgi:DNA primase